VARIFETNVFARRIFDFSIDVPNGTLCFEDKFKRLKNRSEGKINKKQRKGGTIF